MNQQQGSSFHLFCHERWQCLPLQVSLTTPCQDLHWADECHWGGLETWSPGLVTCVGKCWGCVAPVGHCRPSRPSSLGSCGNDHSSPGKSSSNENHGKKVSHWVLMSPRWMAKSTLTCLCLWTWICPCLWSERSSTWRSLWSTAVVSGTALSSSDLWTCLCPWCCPRNELGISRRPPVSRRDCPAELFA